MHIPHIRWLRAFVATTVLAAGASVAHADGYPNKPIRVIVPYAVGGFFDQSARIIAEALSQVLK